MKSEINLNFHFTYGKLKQIADNMVQLIDRDIAEFTDRGYTPARRAELVAQINTFIRLLVAQQTTRKQIYGRNHY
jgi:hypothetical protein